uniref:Uncharacterized protein n=1 Tax=Timema tahoe TaxID=61484 RepID=A0A7R9FG84_9NEOP|nr:unnamed protein product [Timema tahoe]
MYVMDASLRFGLLQTKMALASLVHLYKFRPCPQTLDPMVFDTKSFFLAAKGGYFQDGRVLSDLIDFRRHPQ